MHGLGNDFVIINKIQQAFDIQQLPIAKLGLRHMGIGFDQLLIIEPAQHADFFCRIFNADGSEAEQCGNGLRCVARFIKEEGLHSSTSFKIETKAGIFPLSIDDYDHIRVTMGPPQIQEKLIELAFNNDLDTLPVSILSIGNPHAILKVDSIDKPCLFDLSSKISTHAFFPNGVNVGCMQIINPHFLRLRTFERGVGETFACGSNACAAVVAGIANGWLQHEVNVEFAYGSLLIKWGEGDEPVYMTGPASRVFSGEIFL